MSRLAAGGAGTAGSGGSVSGRVQVVIVGAGFGGLMAARSLADTPVKVLVIDRTNYHLFQPLLYQVAAALQPADIAYPIRGMLRRIPNAKFRLAEVTRVDLPTRRLLTADGSAIAFDELVVAAGATAADFGIPGVEEHAFALTPIWTSPKPASRSSNSPGSC